MRSYVIAMSSIFGLAVSCAAWAQTAAPAPAAPTAQKTSATETAQAVTCRPMVYEGMLLHRQECHTQAEWDHLRYDTQHAFSDFQTRNLASPWR
jgi:hypothetical protein